MSGRFTPIDDLSNAFNLLSPRPFSRQNQYSSVNSGAGGTTTTNRGADPTSVGASAGAGSTPQHHHQTTVGSDFDSGGSGPYTPSSDMNHRQFPFSTTPRHRHDRFGSMESNGGGSGPGGTGSGYGMPATAADGFSSLPRRLGQHFPSAQQLHNPSSFFDDNDFDRRFFSTTDNNDYHSPRMTPMMPEWGFAGTGAGIKPQQSTAFRSSSPFSSETNLTGTGSRMGGRERVIPITVESGGRGRTMFGGGSTRTPPPETKPAPPAKPPELRGYPPREHYTAAPPPKQPPTGSKIVTVNKQEAAPVTTQRQQQQQPPPESVAPPRPVPEFKPEIMMQKVSEAPNLASRLAGKTTRFDEFADVLSKLPKPPRTTFGEFDENLLADMIAANKVKAAPQQQQPPQPEQLRSACPPPSAPQNNAAKDDRVKEHVAVPLEPEVQSSPVVSISMIQISDDAPNPIRLFDEALQESVAEFLSAGAKIGGEVNEISNLTKQAIDAQRAFLWNAIGTKKPDDNQLASLLKPISEKIEIIQNLKNDKRNSPHFNHLSAISEGIPALGWVTVSPTPAPYIKEMIDASQFYVNRVLKDFKEKDKTHVDWTKAWLRILSSLQTYVKQNHTTGLVWNSAPGASAPGGGPKPVMTAAQPPPGPPGPPPPPPPDFLAGNAGAQGGNQADSRAALFADINKGLDITKGLKKITDDMKTHKNPALRATDIVPGSKPTKAGESVSAAPSVQRAPKLELEGGKKWVVEYMNNNRNVVIEANDMKQVVYIFKCTNSVIQIKGKLNSITMDSCNKTSLVFDDLVSSVEIINCQSAQIQSMGTMPTLLIQKTDGCQIYLNKASLNTEIVTSKSSEMNVLVPNDNGEFDEFAVPEQYKTVWDGKKLRTTIVDIA